MNELRIKVVKILPTGENELYRNIVKYPDGVRFPFAFSLLYPGATIMFSQVL